jgi:rfaE bifunctional protein nucleotidyltransferase chain/domain
VTKLVTLNALLRKLKQARAQGKRLVFTNGCFDVLHKGHTTYLQKAKKLGDVLVVGINGDASVRRLKGADRPLNRQKDRAHVLSALACVDHVVIFHEDTPLKLIRAIRPQVLAKGGDWKKKDVVGASFVEAGGGVVRLIPYIRGYSTSEFLRKIQKL